MKKKAIFFMLTSFIVSISYLSNSTNDVERDGSNLSQVGVGSICMAYKSESAAEQAAWGAGGAIAVGLGVRMIISGAPVGWNPVGWGVVAAGAIL